MRQYLLPLAFFLFGLVASGIVTQVIMKNRSETAQAILEQRMHSDYLRSRLSYMSVQMRFETSLLMKLRHGQATQAIDCLENHLDGLVLISQSLDDKKVKAQKWQISDPPYSAFMQVKNYRQLYPSKSKHSNEVQNLLNHITALPRG
jgi:hypothetical protein